MENNVAESCRNKNIIIAGATGFIGKVLVEKIIRAVPSCKKIYLLIRKNESSNCAEKRFFEETLKSPIFESLSIKSFQEFKELYKEKICCITAEISQEQFGLNKNQYEELANNADLFINCSGSVNFREKIDIAFEINVKALTNITDSGSRQPLNVQKINRHIICR